MKKLLNTLFVTSEDAYLSLDGENIVVSRDRHEIGRFPLHTLAGIVSFSYAGASPALMGGCAKRGVGLTFCTPGGRFLARAVGEAKNPKSRTAEVHRDRSQIKILPRSPI